MESLIQEFGSRLRFLARDPGCIVLTVIPGLGLGWELSTVRGFDLLL